VVAAQQVQDAVDDQMAQVIRQGLALRRRLRRAIGVAQHHVAQMGKGALGRREGQHVRRPVLVAEPRVQILHRRVVGQQHHDIALDRSEGRRCGALDDRRRLGQSLRPTLAVDLDLDHQASSSRSGKGRLRAASLS